MRHDRELEEMRRRLGEVFDDIIAGLTMAVVGVAILLLLAGVWHIIGR
jgi:hypothetical protein